MLVVKNPPANSRDVGGSGAIPGLGRSLGGGHGSTLQFPGLENLMDRRAWSPVVHRVAQSRVRLKQLCTHSKTVEQKGSPIPKDMGCHSTRISETTLVGFSFIHNNSIYFTFYFKKTNYS